jgi:hypothetical protein
MNLRAITIICFTICIVCILAAVVVSLFLIWGTGDIGTLWKSLVSIGVFFLASLVMIGVTTIVGPKLKEAKEI